MFAVLETASTEVGEASVLPTLIVLPLSIVTIERVVGVVLVGTLDREGSIMS